MNSLRLLDPNFGDGLQARYVDGVLTLELPKAAAADSRRIAIQ